MVHPDRESRLFPSPVSRLALDPPSLLHSGYMDSFPRGRTATRKARAEVKNDWIYTTPPSYVFMAQTNNLTSILKGRTHNCNAILSSTCSHHDGI